MDTMLTSVVIAALIGFAVNILLCPIVIPILRKIKFGQTPRDDGPKEHLKKTGTPTMGGVMILLSFLAASAFFINDSGRSLLIVFVTLAFGFIGFLDDYIKVAKKRSLGLYAWQKFALQMIVCGIFAYFLNQDAKNAALFIPFLRGEYFNVGWIYIPFVFFVILGAVNGVNFTDGLDGLAAGVTALVAAFFVFISLSLGSEISPVIGAAFGALLGFLLYNAHPAQVFMGDTGSLALGGFIASVALTLRAPLFIPLVGIIYLAEVLSVILQVGYFKMTGGRRIFKMAPLHHHFELMGWPETKVVTVFYIITAIMCLIGFLGIRMILI
jgi:phospho-N-acetylmuramoyl-pentapeptide-transferase